MIYIGNYDIDQLASWISQSEARRRVFISIFQPMTAQHISTNSGVDRSRCSYNLTALSRKDLLYCLNMKANASRLYWLTTPGRECRSALAVNLEKTQKDLLSEDIDWSLYGLVCYRHRSAVIRAMEKPMQPVHIRKRAVYQNSNLKMSANNARDVIRFLKDKDVVAPVHVRRKKHTHYELTETGKRIRTLLLRAEGNR